MADNGLILNSHFLPPEILAQILCFVDPNDLTFNCRLVCKNWNQIIIDVVWKLKMQASNFRSFSNLSDVERKRLKLPWHVCYHIYCKDPFEKNLLLNNCGQNELQHWYDGSGNIVSQQLDWHYSDESDSSDDSDEVPLRANTLENNNKTKFIFVCNEESVRSGAAYEDREESWNRQYRSQGNSGNCVIEPYPIGTDPLPECDDFGGHKSCFVTSYTACVKEQTLDLVKNGLSRFILDTMQPKIVASEWFAGRYDCGFQYKLTVSLLSSDGESVIQRKEVERNSHEPSAAMWEKVSLEFENYGRGVRFVAFNHRGRDSRTWAGFYGVKMAGGVVKATFPNTAN